MIRYVKTMDELVDIIDKEFSSTNPICPICKSKIGTVNIQNTELGLPEFNFMQFKHPGIFCTNGHCLISMELDNANETKEAAGTGSYMLHIEDMGLKVFEVMKLIKPYLGLDESIPNSQLYWMLLNKDNPVYTKAMSREGAYNLLDKLQKLGARVRIV